MVMAVTEEVAMKSNVKVLTEQRARQPQRPNPTKEALDAVVRAVALDANDQPERYLQDTKVPAGGE